MRFHIGRLVPKAASIHARRLSYRARIREGASSFHMMNHCNNKGALWRKTNPWSSSVSIFGESATESTKYCTSRSPDVFSLDGKNMLVAEDSNQLCRPQAGFNFGLCVLASGSIIFSTRGFDVSREDGAEFCGNANSTIRSHKSSMWKSR